MSIWSPQIRRTSRRRDSPSESPATAGGESHDRHDAQHAPPGLGAAAARLPALPAVPAARVVAAHPEQGWSRLCNGVVVFEDTGEILPDRTSIAPHRPGTYRTPRAA
jgi:hypothetical protein